MAMTRTYLLMAGMTALFMVIGRMIGGQAGMMLALAFAAGSNLIAWYSSDKLVLRMYRAEPVNASSAPNLYQIVADLSRRAELPMPRVYIIPQSQPNAFATGRNPQHAAVAVTSGLLQRLSSEEIAGVVAHELAHIKNRDTLTMTITASLAGAISGLANFAFFFGGRDENGRAVNPLVLLAVSLLAPFAAMLVQMAISRTREFEADRVGAQITGNPLWLASALAKLDSTAQTVPNIEAESHPASAHLFIVNPLHRGGLAGLFSTHPDMAQRIARLQNMVNQPV